MGRKQTTDRTYIGDAGNTLSLELAIIKLLNRRSQIGSGLKLDKAANQ